MHEDQIETADDQVADNGFPPTDEAAPGDAADDGAAEDDATDDDAEYEEEELEDEELYDEELYGPTSDAAERLRTLVTYLASNLIDDPQTVEVDARQRGGSVFVSLRVPEDELGKVIGRGGRIARAMRTALMICGSRHNVRASLDIED